MAPDMWFTQFMDAFTAWAKQEEVIWCVILVGSYARGTNHAGSDIDLVLVTTEKKSLVCQPDFIHWFGEISHYQLENYGACTSIRVWYQDGKEVEYGLVDPSWLSLPLDPGTRSVLKDGFQIVLDKNDLFQNIDISEEWHA